MKDATLKRPPGDVLADRSAARLIPFGLRDYARVLALQERLRAERQAGAVPDTWLFGEHPTVVTRGLRSRGEPPASHGLPVHEIDRGGLTTLHSPGQLVIYPIVGVKGGSLAAGRFARALIDAMQSWLASEFGVRAECLPRRPGLFVEGRKLMSIGLSVRRGVSMHGVAINLCNDLSLWNRIVPCGDPSTRPVTLSELLGRSIEPSEQRDSLAHRLARDWGYLAITPCSTDSNRCDA